MSLKTIIEDEIKKATLARQQARLLTLRAIKSQILLEETKPGRTSPELSTTEETQILSKALKQRKESAEIFAAQNRADLADKENGEVAVIEEFLPKQLSEAEVTEKIKEIITRIGASVPSDMGKVMGVATKELAGLTEGKLISQIVKSLLV